MVRKILIFLILLLITYPSISSLIKPGFFPMHDDIQTMRLYEMDKCVRDFQIPCRWVPDMGFGYGYPQFNFYAPLPYYVMEIFYLLGFTVINSVKIGFGLGVLISAVGMYLLAKSFWKSTFSGLLSSLFFIYFPYHAVNVYVRGAMGETWALAMMPLVFYSIYEVIIKENKKAVLWLAFSIFGLITSHNVSTLIFAPYCAIWVVYLLSNKRKDYLKDLIRTSLGTVWGIGLSAFFLLPAWFEKIFVHVETITEGYFNYLAHFVGLKQLLFSSFWGYGSSELGDFDGLFLGVGVVWWILPLFTLILFILLKRKEAKSLIFFILLGWLTLFLIHPKSVDLWQGIGILSYVQFPWRFLGIALFFFSLSIGSVMLVVKGKKTVLFVIAIIIIGFYSGFFSPKSHLNITDEDKFSGESWLKQQTISIFDYLPIYAEFPPSQQSPNTITGDKEINILSDYNGSNWRKWKVEIIDNDTKLKLPIMYFPGWRVTDNGELVDIMPSIGTGIIEMTLASGRHDLQARMLNTPIRTFSNILSLLSILAIVFRKKIFKKLYE